MCATMHKHTAEKITSTPTHSKHHQAITYPTDNNTQVTASMIEIHGNSETG